MSTASKSLFYSGIDSKKGSVVLNKRHIVSARIKSSFETEITMSSGEIFILAMDAKAFGELSFLLSEVEHNNVEVTHS